MIKICKSLRKSKFGYPLFINKWKPRPNWQVNNLSNQELAYADEAINISFAPTTTTSIRPIVTIHLSAIY